MVCVGRLLAGGIGYFMRIVWEKSGKVTKSREAHEVKVATIH